MLLNLSFTIISPPFSATTWLLYLPTCLVFINLIFSFVYVFVFVQHTSNRCLAFALTVSNRFICRIAVILMFAFNIFFALLSLSFLLYLLKIKFLQTSYTATAAAATTTNHVLKSQAPLLSYSCRLISSFFFFF